MKPLSACVKGSRKKELSTLAAGPRIAANEGNHGRGRWKDLPTVKD